MELKIPAGEIRTILDRDYGIKMGQVQRRYKGLSNCSLVVSSPQGQLTVRVSRDARDIPAIKFEDRVTDFLGRHHVPVRSVIKTSSGQPYSLTPYNQTVTVFRFIAGKYLTTVKTCHLEEIGRTLKKLHGVLQNFEGQGQLIHGDFNPGNFVFTGDKISGIYDFEHAHYGAVSEDLVTLLAHYVFLLPDWTPLDIIQAVLRGYNQNTESQTIYHRCGILSAEVLKKAEWLASWQSGSPVFYKKRLTELKRDVKLLAVSSK